MPTNAGAPLPNVVPAFSYCPATMDYRNLLLALAAVAPLSVSAQIGHSPFNTRPNLTACAREPPVFSCENTTAFANSCCNVAKGGLVLQTQFWDTYTGYEEEGQLLPENSWTIHGLWPDNCDG